MRVPNSSQEVEKGDKVEERTGLYQKPDGKEQRPELEE